MAREKEAVGVFRGEVSELKQMGALLGVMMAVCPALNTVPGIEHMLSMDVNSREKKKKRERGSK